MAVRVMRFIRTVVIILLLECINTKQMKQIWAVVAIDDVPIQTDPYFL